MTYTIFSRLMVIAFMMGCVTVVNLFQWYQLLFDEFRWIVVANLTLTSLLGGWLSLRARRKWEICREHLESLPRS